MNLTGLTTKVATMAKTRSASASKVPRVATMAKVRPASAGKVPKVATRVATMAKIKK